MKKQLFSIVLVVIAGLGAISTAVAQTQYYNQHHLLPLLNNPAAGAMSSYINGTFGYRSFNIDQGASVLNSPTFNLSYPFFQRNKVDTNRIGYAGLVVIGDRTGANGLVNTTGAALSFGYNLPISDKVKVATGMQIGFFQRRLDLSRLTTGSQFNNNSGGFDPTLPNGETDLTADSRTYPIVNLGAMIYSENEFGENEYYAGISANNLNRPNTSFQANSDAKLPINLIAQAGYTLLRDKDIFLTPNFRYIFQNTNQSLLNIGTLVSYRLNGNYDIFGRGSVGVGAWYSTNNSVITSIELNQPSFVLGFSYDWFFNNVNQNNPAFATEVVFTVRKYIGKRRPKYNPKARRAAVEEVEEVRAVAPTPKPAPAPTPAPKVEEVKPVAPPVVTPTPVAPAEPVAPKVEEQPEVEAKPAPAPRVTPKAGPLTKTEKAFIEGKVKPRYAFNDYSLRDSDKAKLDELAIILKRRPKVRLLVEGHSCNIGNNTANQYISKMRAEEARKYLVAKGISASRLVLKPMGARKPKRPNTTEANRSMNRRVEFKVLPK